MGYESSHAFVDRAPAIDSIMLADTDTFLSSADLARLEALCRELPQELVTVGDASELNHVYVGRFMTDIERPELVNRPLSDEAIDLLAGERAMSFFRNLLGSEKYFVRRMQVNTLEENCFVGYHTDTDSNPDYDFNVIIQLGRDYEGGEFVIYDDKVPKCVFKPAYGSMLISDCRLPHEVKKVTKGKRVSLVYFLSRHSGPNRRKKIASESPVY